MRLGNGSHGHTLIELCLGVTLIAVLAGLAVPGFRAALRGAAVRSAAFELAAGLRQARAASILESRTAVFCLSDAAGKCLAGVDSSFAWAAYLEVDGHAEPVAAGALPRGVTLYASRTKLSFWPDTRAGSTGTLTICDSQGVAPPRAIVLSQVGRLRFADGSAAACGT
ncbi:MAG TPA: GspH/FimT family pseudopilin [Steroidobacteraceae bacterium]|jgi:type IV fimbrial biogenesis protein FimT|nr:GspH/FimT family pseudopilin [Steroidobacteraceae bacterium]